MSKSYLDLDSWFYFKKCLIELIFVDPSESNSRLDLDLDLD